MLRKLNWALDEQFYRLEKTPHSRPERQEQLRRGIEKRKIKLEDVLVEFGLGRERLQASLAVARRLERMIKQASVKGDRQKLETLRIFVRMPLAEFQVTCQNLPDSGAQ